MGSYHAILSLYMYSCSSITPRLRYHAVLSTYILSCNSITPRHRYHAVLSTYILSSNSITPRFRYHAVLIINIHSNMPITSSKWTLLPCSTCYQPTSSHAIPSLHCLPRNPSAHKICSYPISQRTVAMPLRPLEAKTQPVSVEQSCLHTALQINRNCLARYISYPSQCTRAVS